MKILLSVNGIADWLTYLDHRSKLGLSQATWVGQPCSQEASQSPHTGPSWQGLHMNKLVVVCGSRGILGTVCVPESQEAAGILAIKIHKLPPFPQQIRGTWMSSSFILYEDSPQYLLLLPSL